MDKRGIQHLVELTVMGRPAGPQDPVDLLAAERLSQTGRAYALELFASQLEQVSAMGLDCPEAKRIINALVKLKTTNNELRSIIPDSAFSAHIIGELEPLRRAQKTADKIVEGIKRQASGPVAEKGTGEGTRSAKSKIV